MSRGLQKNFKAPVEGWNGFTQNLARNMPFDKLSIVDLSASNYNKIHLFNRGVCSREDETNKSTNYNKLSILNNFYTNGLMIIK